MALFGERLLRARRISLKMQLNAKGLFGRLLSGLRLDAHDARELSLVATRGQQCLFLGFVQVKSIMYVLCVYFHFAPFEFNYALSRLYLFIAPLFLQPQCLKRED